MAGEGLKLFCQCHFYLWMLCKTYVIAVFTPSFPFLYVSNDLEYSSTVPFSIIHPCPFHLEFSYLSCLSLYPRLSWSILIFQNLSLWWFHQLVFNTCITTGPRDCWDPHPGRDRKESGCIPIPSIFYAPGETEKHKAQTKQQPLVVNHYGSRGHWYVKYQ